MNLMTYAIGVQHIGIPTDQFSATMDFYTKLGFVLKIETINPATGCNVAFLSGSGVMMEVYQIPAGAMCDGAVDHVAFGVTDIEDACRTAVSHGFTILEPNWSRKFNSFRFWKTASAFSL